MEDTWKTVEPNDGHRAVAELVARGIASHVITQNIDALHQHRGVPDEQGDRTAWQYPPRQMPGLRRAG